MIALELSEAEAVEARRALEARRDRLASAMNMTTDEQWTALEVLLCDTQAALNAVLKRLELEG